MSHDATNWAIKQRGIKPATKVVLWHLCDRYHPDHGCFPSLDTLADDCEMSRRSVQDQLDALQEAGLILVEKLPRERGQMPRNCYRFSFEDGFVSLGQNLPMAEFALGKNEHPPLANSRNHLGQNLPTNLVRVTSKRTSKREREETPDFLRGLEAPKADPLEETLTALYAEFPKRTDGKYSRPAAIRPLLKAALKKIRPEELLICVRNYAASDCHKGGEYARKAVNWLKDEDWQSFATVEAPVQPRRDELDWCVQGNILSDLSDGLDHATIAKRNNATLEDVRLIEERRQRVAKLPPRPEKPDWQARANEIMSGPCPDIPDRKPEARVYRELPADLMAMVENMRKDAARLN
jgi:hypothetical protein